MPRPTRDAALSACGDVLTDGLPTAVRALRKLLNDADPGIRFRAAAKLVELTLVVTERVDIAERLTAIEEQLENPAAAQYTGPANPTIEDVK